MKIVLVAINAKYIHSNLAVYSLKASVPEYEDKITLIECTVNQQPEEIFSMIFREQPKLLFFSCYIWNRELVLETAENVKKVLPETKIWAGGPEVSWEPAGFLKENPQFDGLMRGEGEKTFAKLLQYYETGSGRLEDIPGLAFRRDAGGQEETRMITGDLWERKLPLRTESSIMKAAGDAPLAAAIASPRLKKACGSAA